MLYIKYLPGIYMYTKYIYAAKSKLLHMFIYIYIDIYLQIVPNLIHDIFPKIKEIIYGFVTFSQKISR